LDDQCPTKQRVQGPSPEFQKPIRNYFRAILFDKNKLCLYFGRDFGRGEIFLIDANIGKEVIAVLHSLSMSFCKIFLVLFYMLRVIFR